MDSLPQELPRALADRRAGVATTAPFASLPDDGAGHGLAVLGAAVGADDMGVAPDASWSSVNALGGGIFDPEGFAAAIDWLILDARPDVVIVPWDVPEDLPAWQLGVAFGALRTAGMAVVFPAGNSGPTMGVNRAPANLVGLAPDAASAFSVGGVDAALAAYDASNRGPNARDMSIFPLVAAPAVRLRLVADATGGVREGNGTSFAAGYAGGALALLLAAHPEMTGPQAEARLIQTARDIGSPGPDNTFGHGLIDLERALAP